MYNKILSALAALMLLSPMAQAVTGEDVAKAVQQAAASQLHLSTKAHEKAVVPIRISVEAKFQHQSQDEPNILEKKCAAVRISSGYLLASMACVGLQKTANATDHHGSSYKKQVAYRKIRYIKVDGVKVSNRDIRYSEKAKLILIRLDGRNNDLVDKVQSKALANLFVPKNPNKIKNMFSQVFYNRTCYPIRFGRTCTETCINGVCRTNPDCYLTDDEIIDGDTGDPLFGLNPQQSTMEFLLGFNAAEPDGASRTSGRKYFYFTPESIRFIKENVSSTDWQEIQRKIVDESFFK